MFCFQNSVSNKKYEKEHTFSIAFGQIRNTWLKDKNISTNTDSRNHFALFQNDSNVALGCH
jgi:hypothetical protein